MAVIRGVNLGGWFVLEQWMAPSLFLDLKKSDETDFMLRMEEAHTKLEQHYNSFITEKDFKALKNLGITHVRLPIPWWFLGDYPYHQSVNHIHRALELAGKYQIEVLLDLHTAPGCQNGFDNGGITGVINWPKDIENINLTIERLGLIAETFMKHASVYGIEVLNEPHVSIPIDIMLDFYNRAYVKLRSITDKNITFHDAFRPELIEIWENFFKNKVNVHFDLHLYHCFNPEVVDKTADGRLDEVLNDRLKLINTLSAFVPIIIGEWSLGIHKLPEGDDFKKHLFMREFATKQLALYEQAYGYYFWSYKIDRKSHYGWDFRRSIKLGLLPKKY